MSKNLLVKFDGEIFSARARGTDVVSQSMKVQKLQIL